jgi:hypothetical protein
MKYVNHVVTPRSITLIYNDGKIDRTATVQMSDVEKYTASSEAIKAGKFDSLLSIIRPEEMMNDLGDGFSLENGIVSYNGEGLPNVLSTKIILLIKSSLSFEPVKNLWKKASLLNEVSRKSLVEFIIRNNVTILPDGNFILYKMVRHDMTSHHDGETRHYLGQPLTINRSSCDQDPHVQCGRGLHAAPFSWVSKNYKSGLMLEVALNPEHVVSVPREDTGKIRCCWQLPLRIVGRDEEVKASTLKEGELVNPVSIKDIPKEIKEARTKRRKESSRGGLLINATTDRVTIPAVVMLDAGFKANDELSVFITDRRSRFLLVCPERHLKRFSKEYKCVDSVSVKSLSTGSVSLRAPTLTMAKIWVPKTAASYRVKVISRNLVEIRLNS